MAYRRQDNDSEREWNVCGDIGREGVGQEEIPSILVCRFVKAWADASCLSEALALKSDPA